MAPPSVTLLRTQTDERLVALARTGHERAFEAIVERYRRPLLRHCRRFLPEARAEDALQQALVSAWTALQRGDDVRDLRPWLYRIVHNTSLNALRASGYDYEQLHDTLQGSGGPAELAERSAVVRSTLAGLAALPDRQRDAILRIAVEGRSQDEVAQELGLTEGAVRQLVHRARTSLRAAATALTPFPIAGWLASGAERGDVAARVGELVAGGGASATLAKAGAVAVLAGGAVSGPAVVQHFDNPPRAAGAVAAAPAAKASAGGTADHVGGGAKATPVSTAPIVSSGRRSGRAERGSGGKGGSSGKGRSGHGQGGKRDDRSGSHRGRSGGGDDRSGSGSGSGRSGGSDDHSGSGRSGSGGGDDGSGRRRSGSGSGDDTPSGSSGDDSKRSGSSGGGDDTPSSSGGAPLQTGGSGESGSGKSGSGSDGAPPPSAAPAPVLDDSGHGTGSGHGSDDLPKPDDSP